MLQFNAQTQDSPQYAVARVGQLIDIHFTAEITKGLTKYNSLCWRRMVPQWLHHKAYSSALQSYGYLSQVFFFFNVIRPGIVKQKMLTKKATMKLKYDKKRNEGPEGGEQKSVKRNDQ